jgi:hemerythrin-like domain-containing protein
MPNPIKRHESFHPLSHDHHHGLVVAQLLKKCSPDYKNLPSTTEGKKDYAVQFYNTELVRHFEDEEKVLYPFVKSRDNKIDSLFEEIIVEHQQIKKLITKLKSNDDVEDTMDELGYLLESHIRKEERELFTDIQKILTEEELIQLGKKLKR